MFGQRVPLVGAACGFVLSFLIGLLSGAELSVIFVRAILSAALLGAVAFASAFAVSRFLPELTEDTDTADPADRSTGSMVDVTVGESNEPLPGFTDRGDDMVPDFLSGPSNGTVEGFGSLSASSDSFVPGLTVSGTLSANGNAAGMGLSGDNRGSSPDAASRVGKSGQKTVADGLDILPEIEDFVPAKKAGEVEPDSDEATVASSMGFGSSVASEVKNAGIESETMAKAIRTILSRDS
jgi:hypothetical protein